MLILISDISKLDSQIIDYVFLDRIPSYRLKTKNKSDIQKSINSLKLLKIGLNEFGIDLLNEDLVYNEFGRPNLKEKTSSLTFLIQESILHVLFQIK